MSEYRRPRAALGACLACVVLAAGAVACGERGRGAEPGDEDASAKLAGEVEDALDELLSWEGVTAEASLAAPTEQAYEYLRLTGAASGTRPSANDARRLTDLELTVSAGSPTENAVMREMDDTDPLYTAMTVSFGGNDALGVKNIDGGVYARVNPAAIAQDVLHGDAAEVAGAERFARDATRLPGSLYVPREALAGEWIPVDPFLYDAYAEALSTGETAVVEPGVAEDVAGALTDAGALVTPEAEWAFIDGLRAGLVEGDATYRRAGGERGAEVVELRMPAGEAWSALGPLMTLFAGQAERFGVPPVVAEPSGEAAARPVTAGLMIRDGVLSGVTLDLAQFGPAGDSELPSLPLSVTLTGGSALSLTAPLGEVLRPEDLTLTLLYLRQEAEERESEPGRAELPGPMQPGS